MSVLLELARRAIGDNVKARPMVDVRMNMSQFAVSGKVVRIRSEVLGCDVIFAADNADPDEAGASGLPIYWARELRELIGVEPEHLRLIHETKTVFEGEIIP